MQAGNWYHNQYIWKENSAENTADGTMIYIFNCDMASSYNDCISYGSHPDDSRWKYLLHIGWYDSWGVDIPDNYYIYFDEIYVDTTWARVEIGNSSEYGKCIHREMQIPQKWSNQEIEIMFNLGSFELGDRIYLFVINKEGTVSNGYPLFQQTENPMKQTWNPDAESNPQNIPNSDKEKISK